MLKIIPLGGLGEVGMNTMVFEHAGRRLLVEQSHRVEHVRADCNLSRRR
jgi:mRNA degradation ribonuclease J1/J2